MSVTALIGGRAGKLKQFPSWVVAAARRPPGTWCTHSLNKSAWYYVKQRGMQPIVVDPKRVPNYVHTMMLVLG